VRSTSWRHMIARIWHGWTKLADTKTYENMLRDEIFPSIAARNIKGYRGAELFIREHDDEMEFVTLLRFDSMDAVKQFAGSDETRPVIFPGVEKLLTRKKPARHYLVAI
jgi:antibiotic biosynthesis monooxygenase (ABM) superfamily enzyme